MIVISGINLFEGGPLTVYYDCLDAIKVLGLNKKYRICVLVSKKELFKKYEKDFEIIEFPKSRNNYLYRLYYEYCYFYKYSKTRHIEIWLSLHDITPNVRANAIYTYCHNPSPFMKKDFRNTKYSLKNVMFSIFYRYLYQINIEKASGIIVQQDWMREEFKKMYHIRNVIVARPKIVDKEIEKLGLDKNCSDKKIFIYAAFPRFYKNYELICEACRYIKGNDYEVWLTINGTENRYARYIYKKYSDISKIKWLGLQPREKIFELYNNADCLIFPSKLETWGLPISEFKITGKDMLLADLPYAYETLGTYNKVMFFDVNNAQMLAEEMESIISGKEKYKPQEEKVCDEPYAEDWFKLLKLLTERI